MLQQDSFFVPTRSSISSSTPYSCVVHELATKTKSKFDEDGSNLLIADQKESDQNSAKNKSKEELNAEMKRFRLDVYKFAKNGMNAKDKFTSDMQLAIRLGAERPKRTGKNYVDLKNDIMKAKEVAAKHKSSGDPTPIVSTDISMKKKPLNLTKKMRIARKKGDIGGMLNVYGKVNVKEAKLKKHSHKN